MLGLEVSRLARNSSDWHRLLEICALTDTLICDEDGIYNPAHFNDRLLLGLKGTMSEAELHVLRARLLGGQLAKASRGELEMRLPVGLVNDAAGHVVLDPDAQVQDAVRTFFDTFARTGSATATVKSFQRAGVAVPAPTRERRTPRRGGLGTAAAQPGPAPGEEPALHRRLRLRAQPDQATARRQGAAPRAAARSSGTR